MADSCSIEGLGTAIIIAAFFGVIIAMPLMAMAVNWMDKRDLKKDGKAGD